MGMVGAGAVEVVMEAEEVASEVEVAAAAASEVVSEEGEAMAEGGELQQFDFMLQYGQTIETSPRQSSKAFRLSGGLLAFAILHPPKFPDPRPQFQAPKTSKLRRYDSPLIQRIFDLKASLHESIPCHSP